jgi:hypothetical protein
MLLNGNWPLCCKSEKGDTLSRVERISVYELDALSTIILGVEVEFQQLDVPNRLPQHFDSTAYVYRSSVDEALRRWESTLAPGKRYAPHAWPVAQVALEIDLLAHSQYDRCGRPARNKRFGRNAMSHQVCDLLTPF